MDRAAVASVEVPSRSPGGARRRGGSTEATDARNAVVQRLQRQGFTVVAPPNALRGPTSDAAYIASFLQTIPGPIVLVAHSYGGFVITNAATGNPNVKALVYIDAFVPDEGQTVGELAAGSCVDPATGVNVVLSPGGVVDLYLRADHPAQRRDPDHRRGVDATT